MAAAVQRVVLLAVALSCSNPSPELVCVRPVPRDIERALSTNGRIEAASRAVVQVATAGRVERVFVQRGDSVKNGQELLRLADLGQVAARTQAQARLEGARARLAQFESGMDPARKAVLQSERSKLSAAGDSAARDLERLGRLVARNAAPRSELEAKRRLLDDLELDVEAVDRQLAARPPEGRRSELEASVRHAEAVWRAADQEVERLSIRAPMAGQVYSLPVVGGEFLVAGGLAARIGEVGTVRARVFVDEPDLGRIEPGDVARITADAYPGQDWDCEVDRLATEIVALGPRRVGEVVCNAANPDGRLLPNLAVGVRIVTDRAERVLSLPRSAVRRSDGRAYVWVLNEGRASKRSVDLGVEGPVFVEVRRGVEASESVLIPGDGPISEGRRVSARPQGDTDG